MTLDETIRDCVHFYPSLFESRISALDHLYCVLGNGYDWQDGVLVERGTYKPFEPMVRLEHQRQAREEEFSDALSGVLSDWYVKRAAVIRRVHENEQAIVTGAMNYTLVGKHGFYPLTAISCPRHLSEVPDDVQPDWLAGAVEVAELIIAFGEHFDRAFVVGEFEDDTDRRRENAQANAAVAKVVLADLRARFPGCSAPPGLGLAGLTWNAAPSSPVEPNHGVHPRH
jgi:hypothetical protein